MATFGFLDCCRFTPTAGGTTAWTVSAAVTGYQTPALAGAVNGTVYRYRAESTDLSQWEVGYGAYTVSGTVLARTTVLYNSSGTGTAAGQSGAGNKISFSVAPQVAIVFLAEDAISPASVTGSWTPADNSGAGLSFTGVSAGYTQIGNMVFAYATLTYPTTADGTNASISGFPVAFPNVNYARQGTVTVSTEGTVIALHPSANTSTAAFKSETTGSTLTNANMSLATVYFNCIYPAA